MKGADKTKEQLVRESAGLRQRIAELEVLEVEREQAEESLRKRTAELERSNVLISALARVAAQFGAALDPDQVIKTLGAELARLGMQSFVALPDPGAQALVLRYTSVESKSLALAERLAGLKAQGLRIPRERFPLYDQLVRQGQPQFVEPISQLVADMLPDVPRSVRERIIRLAGVSPSAPTIYLPLPIEEQVHGTLAMWGGDLQREDIPVLSVFAGQVAAALGNARLHEAVLASEEMYRTLVETSPGAVTVADLEGNITYASRRMLELHGFESEEELLGKNTLELVAPGDHERAMSNLQRTLEETAVRDEEYTLLRKDGSCFPGELSAALIKSASGEPAAFIGVIRDITDRKRAEEELRRHRDHLEEVVRERTGELTRANEQLRREVAERNRAEREIQQRSEDLALLNTLNAAGNRGESLQTIVDLLVEGTKRIFSSHGATVYLVSEDEQYLVMQNLALPSAAVGRIEKLIGRSIPPMEIPLQAGSLHLELLQAGKPVITNDPETIQQLMAGFTTAVRLPEQFRQALRKLVPQICNILGIQSVLSVPLISEAGVVGLLDISSNKPLSEADLRRFAIISEQLTAIIERKRADEALQRYVERLRTMRAIDGAILAAWATEEVAQAALRHIRRLVPCQRACVAVFDLEAQEATALAVHVDGETRIDTGARFPLDDFGDVEALRQGKISVVEDVLALSQPSPVVQALRSEKVRSFVNTPLIVHGELIGSLNLGANKPAAFTPEHLEIIYEVGGQIAVALRQARLYEQVRHYVTELERRVAERTADLSVANAELARAARLKDEFLASMSHELRTPLNAVLGMSEALQEEVYGPLNERQLKSLRTIEESGRHLLALINDILDVSKVEAGKVELQIRPVSVESVCRASLELIKQSAHKKRLKVSFSFDSTVTTLQADERRLKQILVNLLNNAVKFTPEGGEVGLEVMGDSEGPAVHFTVWDTGIGIAPEEMGRLFKPFVQLDSSLSRQHSGTGLGLVLVQRMTEMHGGGVSVESEPAQGSRFTVSLPWVGPMPGEIEGLAEAAEPVREMEPGEADLPGISALRQALIVEDSPAAASQLARYLAELDIETVVHSRGADAVDRALAVAPDVIVLDLLLPDVSGWEVLTRLKEDTRTQDIPVLVVSVVDERRQGLVLDAGEYLVKPISRRQLQEALSRIASRGMEARKTLVVAPEQAGAPGPAVSRAGQPLILLAEDDEAAINTVSNYLLARGYRVVVARNGGEAVERAREERPDLILMDVQMPGMDGLEATRRIRADVSPSTGLRTSLAEVPIVALTALAMPGDRERCLEAGVNEYMSKPVGLRKLTEVIEAQIGH